MSVVLKSVDDPRDNLEKAGKYELWKFAIANGVADATFEMPSSLLRKKLRALGLVNISIPERQLGDPRPLVYGSDTPAKSAPVKQNSEVAEIDADALLEREFSAPQVNPVKNMSMTELRTACKQRGIKMVRTDNMNTLREKLSGQNAA